MLKKHLSKIFKILVIVAVIFLVIWINSLALSENALIGYVERFGYFGVFLVSALSGFNVVVPIPISSFFPVFLEAGFHPSITIAAISLGMIVGDIFGYALGRSGRSIIKEKKDRRFFAFIENLEKKHRFLPYGFLAIYAAFIPLPNELVVIPMAFLKFRFQYMILALFLGNIIFNIVVATTFVGLAGIIS